MSAKLINYVDWPAENGIIAHCCCDTAAELPAVNAFSSIGTLVATSTCKVINESATYQLNTQGVWKKKTDATSVALDLTGYYTSSEVDAAITAAIRASVVGSDIPANFDLDTFVDVGHKNCSAVNAQSCAHRPLGTQNGGFGVTNSLIYTTDGSADRVRQEVIYNVTGQNVARNRTFWRYLSSAGWSDWYEVTTSVVVVS